MKKPASGVGMANEVFGQKQHETRSQEIIEIIEAFILALVAVATAWAGYQAAVWNGQQSRLYGESSKQRITADQLATLGGQERIYDTMTANFWINAKSDGNEKLATVYERRFRDEFRVAFNAWIALDPLTNPQATPGPTFMPEYHDANNDKAAQLDAQASATFDEGTVARDHADGYVRVTLYLATVLLLIAISQKFRFRPVRIALLAIAAILLGVGLSSFVTFPRL
jgi:hypothetical protein